MPFPRNWVEELVIEWLHLKGFLVEANLPIGAAKPGGRLEADVVGAKIDDNDDVMQIIHLEVGQLSGGVKGAESIVKKKFSKNAQKQIEKYFRKRMSFENKSKDKINYKKIYVATYWTKPTLEILDKNSVKTNKLPDFIHDEILPTIRCYKKNPLHPSKLGGATLPESYWLLQLIDYLDVKKMLK